MARIEEPATLANLEKLIEFAVGSAQGQGLGPEALGQVRLACEEALVNVIHYAYPGAEGKVAVDCGAAEGGGIKIEISDSGIAFDPLSLPAPDTTLPMEQRKIGGLGIFMIRKIMDQVLYRRDGGRNVLTLLKKK